MSLASDVARAARCRCPACGKGKLFTRGLNVVQNCDNCGAPLGDHDIGDGAVVFLTFVLGFSIVPAAWVLELWLAPPVWVQVVLWGVVGIGLTLGMLPVLKSYILLLQYRHRPGGWKKGDDGKQP